MVASQAERRYSDVIRPMQVVSLGGGVSLFVCAALSDATYARPYEIQWLNFAAWLIIGGLVFSGIALLFALNDLSRANRRASGIATYVVTLLCAWVLGVFDELAHARDAWGSMPSALVLSVIVTLLTCLATWFGTWTPR